MMVPTSSAASAGTDLEHGGRMHATKSGDLEGAHSTGPFKYAPLLAREEEERLARQYRETRDPAIASILVESHLRLVAKIARQCCSRPDLLPDLIQEGCMGLMRAVEKYDPDRGVRLASYAAWWIRALIYHHIMTNSRMMRIATTFAQRKLFFNLNRTVQRLERDGKEALSKDVADQLGLPEGVVVEMRARMAHRDVQLETTAAVDQASVHQRLDGVVAPDQPDELVEASELKGAVSRRVAEVVATLDARERAIFDERLMADKPTTLNVLGAKFGVSRERARQLEERLKERLRPLFLEFRGGPAAGPSELGGG
jgi:RNA polymerase sigma-32 factor